MRNTMGDTKDNLPASADELLRDDLNEQGGARQAKAREADRIASMWNAFNERNGSFADEHSTLFGER